jgi:purine-nucleoside phosphorylase
MKNKIAEASAYLQSRLKEKPLVAVVLGTGLNALADTVDSPVYINYCDVPHMPKSTAPSHVGRFVCGYLNGSYIIFMQGRVHYYEGYHIQEVIFPIRLFQALEIDTLILTNAAGSLNPDLQPGDIVALLDHVNLMGVNPLIGADEPQLGERFPSMNEPYNKELRNLAHEIAEKEKINLKDGIYAGLTGPSLETRTECKMLAQLGIDLVGMSTVPEVIVGVQSKMKIIAFSIVTNLSNIFHDHPHSQEEIRQNADLARNNLEKLIKNIIMKIRK